MKTLILILALAIKATLTIGQGLTKTDSLQQILTTLESPKAKLEEERQKIAEQISNIKDQMQFLAEQKSYKDGRLWVKCKGAI